MAVNPDLNLAGLEVLVVEDEMMVSMMIEDMLLELGCRIVGPAADLARALLLARESAIDLAILDVNLNGVQSGPVADRLLERGVPFIFATGYGTSGVREAHRHVPTLSKPSGTSDLAKGLRAACKS